MRALSVLALLICAAFASVFPGDAFAEDPPTGTPRNAQFGETFTYQGRLTDDGVPANGTYDFQFYLYDAATLGNQVGSPVSKTLSVANGIFTADLFFSGDALDQGDSRWVEVRVKKPADQGFVLLNPRQKLTPTPYSVTAEQIPGGTSITFGDSNWGLLLAEGTATYSVAAYFGTRLTDSVTGITGYGIALPPMTSTGGAFLGGTAGVYAESSAGYGVRSKSNAAARAGVLGENKTSTCTGGTIGADDPLGQFCYGVAGLATSTTGGVGVFGSGGYRAVWGTTSNASGWSAYFQGGKVEVAAGTTLVNASDGRFKKDITSLSAGIDELLALKPSSYAWKSDDASTPHYGFIAQDVREVLPDLVTEDPDGSLAVESLGLLPVIVHAIQQQQTQIDALGGSPAPDALAVAAPTAREFPSNAMLAAIAEVLLFGMFVAGFAGVVAGRRFVR